MALRLVIIFLLIANVFKDVYGSLEEELCLEKQCIEKTHVDSNDLKRFGTGLEYPDAVNFKCYILCITVKLGFASESGSMNYEKILDRHGTEHREKLKTEIEKCKITNQTEPCHDVWSFYKCFR